MKSDLTKYCQVLLAAGVIALSSCATSGFNPGIAASKQSGKVPKNADLLFVQNARSVSFSKSKMTLRGDSAEWGGGSGSATGYRGNSVS